MTSTRGHFALVALVALVAVVAVLGGCARPDLTVRAPARIERALSVASDLGATAALVPKGKKALPAEKLTRGDDGVTFSGFLAADPGEYTLAITFDGVVASVDGRHFLGRLTSDPFTVRQGQAATPGFNKQIDTVGGSDDHGDDDGDGLGFLDELLLGSDPTVADSDGDQIDDGKDCKPTDAGDAYVILTGGSVDDCDGDGYVSITALLGDAGLDCNDEDPAVNPGAHDDCTDFVDEDCNPQTCPSTDIAGPDVSIESPADGSTIGCNTPLVVHATDASDVASVTAQTPDDPLATGPRLVAFVADSDRVTWRSDNGFGFAGNGLVDGPLAVDFHASDNRANGTTVHAHYTLALSFPSVTMTGPGSIADGAAVDVTVTPTGTRPLASLELRAAPLDQNNQLVLASEQVVATLPAAGGTASVDPSQLPADSVVYPVAVDDVGNTAGPSPLSATWVPSLGTITAGWFCDGNAHDVPGIAHHAALGPVTALAHLQDAITAAQAVDPTAYLVIIIGFGVRADGTVNLSSSDFFQWIYGFAVPSRIQQLGDNANGISVTYLSAGFGPVDNPSVSDQAGNIFEQDAIQDVAGLIDSDVVAAHYSCGGNGLQGTSDDYIQYIRSTGFNADQVDVTTADGYNWGVHADDLNVETFGCSPP